jgi:hypothetical protein
MALDPGAPKDGRKVRGPAIEETRELAALPRKFSMGWRYGNAMIGQAERVLSRRCPSLVLECAFQPARQIDLNCTLSPDVRSALPTCQAAAFPGPADLG